MRRFGIVIPAYRDAGTLARSLTSIARQSFDGELHVVVAVNDGDPATRRRAEHLARPVGQAGHRCTVISTDPGRAKAFHAAEGLLPRAPRLYLDQDAALSDRAVAVLAATLRPQSGIHFAAPRLAIASSPSVVSRAYYSVYTQLPYVQRSPVTIGAYAVSPEGRERWARFPALHSDDKFVRLHFDPAERAVVDATYEVMAPQGPAALVRVRRRHSRGNHELKNSGTLPSAMDLPRARGAFTCLARRPASVVFLAVYGAAATAELWASARRRLRPRGRGSA